MTVSKIRVARLAPIVAVLAFACAVMARTAAAGDAPPARPDPLAILAQAKAATGGGAWDALRTQHSEVKLAANATDGRAERWASMLTGRSRMRFELGRTIAVVGYDGLNAWSEDAGGHFRVETEPITAQLAVNAAYRDRLAFWFPDRQAAKIDYVRREAADGASFDVVDIIPEGGRPFEVWVNTATHRIERLREGESGVIRTELYSDFRTVQGVTVPFTVVAWRGDRHPDREERYVVQRLEYNVPLDDVQFAPPRH